MRQDESGYSTLLKNSGSTAKKGKGVKVINNQN